MLINDSFISSRELIKLGFRVRAGVRNAQRAGPLVQVIYRKVILWLG